MSAPVVDSRIYGTCSVVFVEKGIFIKNLCIKYHIIFDTSSRFVFMIIVIKTFHLVF